MRSQTPLQITMQIYRETPTIKVNKGKQKEEELRYNKPFTEIENENSHKKQKNTAPEEDTIHPQMIKKNYHQRH